MPSTRDAVATLKGYYYQFDYCIIQILKSATDDTIVAMEVLEDVDINTVTETTAVQCKYYAGTDYNHSKIAQPIRFMLRDYVKHEGNPLKYKLYGYYRSGADKLSLPLTLDFVKKHFLTYTEKGVVHEFHTENGISDDQINSFLTDLEINLHAQEYGEQEAAVQQSIKKVFRVRAEQQVEFYYNQALGIVRKLCTSPNIADRQITKKAFVDALTNGASKTFDAWYLEKRGRAQYCKFIRSKYFSTYNLSPAPRFFLIDANGSSVAQLVKLLKLIKIKYAKFGLREAKPFCPFVYVHNVTEADMALVMGQLTNDQLVVRDGYAFRGAVFDAQALATIIQKDQRVDLKVLYTIDELNQTLALIRGSKQIYQFYLDDSYFTIADDSDIKIYISELNDIQSII